MTDGPDQPPQRPSLPPLGRAGSYDLLFELAAGGMATVFLARGTDDRAGAPLVALKRPHRHLASDKTFLSMIVDEARLASAIKHPNVVQVRELGFEASEPFIVLDYVEGGSLSDLRKELSALERALEPRVAVRIALDALAGLHAAHELRDETGKHLGIIHRDVSPHNVLVGADGLARLTDFGIAKAEDRVQVTRTHEVKGKLAYLAPERVDRRRICTIQSDVFSMAVVLWESIAGRRLFRGEAALDTLDEVIKAPIPTLRQLGSTLPQALDEAIARGLSRDLDVRFKTARDFAVAVEKAAGRDGVASAKDVGRVVEAVFGPTLRARHDLIRHAVPAAEAERLLRLTGLPLRAPLDASAGLVNQRAEIASLAPAAPSQRYALGGLAAAPPVVKKRSRGARNLAVAAVAGLALGGLGVWVATRSPATTSTATAKPTPVGPAAPANRHLHVRLPFLATGAALDGVDHPIAPAADAFDAEIAGSEPSTHRLVVTSVDGSRAEGTLLERDGEGVIDEHGLAFTSAPATATSPLAVATETTQPAAPAVTARVSSGTAPVGTVRNGFTKLK